MSTPQDSLPLLTTDTARAGRIAEAMNAEPGSSRDNHPWTAHDVIVVALARGLAALEKDYLTSDQRSQSALQQAEQ